MRRQQQECTGVQQQYRGPQGNWIGLKARNNRRIYLQDIYNRSSDDCDVKQWITSQKEKIYHKWNQWDKQHREGEIHHLEMKLRIDEEEEQDMIEEIEKYDKDWANYNNGKRKTEPQRHHVWTDTNWKRFFKSTWEICAPPWTPYPQTRINLNIWRSTMNRSVRRPCTSLRRRLPFGRRLLGDRGRDVPRTGCSLGIHASDKTSIHCIQVERVHG